MSLPKHIWENVPDITQYENKNPVGSGPFVFVEHEPQKYYKLRANEKYHLGRPLVDEILLIIMSDPEAMLLAFSKGEIDVTTWSIPYASINSVENIPSVKLHRAVEVGAHFAFLNCQRYPLNETLFRRALYHLINVSEVVKTVFLGYAIPGALGFIPPHIVPWHNMDLPPKEEKYVFSLDKARDMLSELGIIDVNNDGWREMSNGMELKLTIYSYTGDPSLIRIAEILVNNLRKVGVRAEHRSLELTTLLNNLITGDFDIVVILGGDIEPDILYDFIHSNGGFNFGKCSFPDLDALLEKQRFEIDVEKRKKTLREIQEKIAYYVPLLVIAHQEFVFAYRTDNFDGWVVGPVLRPDNYFSFMNVYNVKLVKTTPYPIAISTTPVTSPTPHDMYLLIVIGIVLVAVIVLVLYLTRGNRR
ncbi:MAG: ABC transporter substrate-binding protein [Desulfurococcaceae archaeon]